MHPQCKLHGENFYITLVNVAHSYNKNVSWHYLVVILGKNCKGAFSPTLPLPIIHSKSIIIGKQTNNDQLTVHFTTYLPITLCHGKFIWVCLLSINIEHTHTHTQRERERAVSFTVSWVRMISAIARISPEVSALKRQHCKYNFTHFQCQEVK